MASLRAAVLVSGRGSNLQALIDAARLRDFPVEIALVISNVPGVYALERAEKAAIPHTVINHREFQDRLSFDQAVNRVLHDERIDFVCLAGFMRLLTPDFISDWPEKIINIHPALLPSFKGLHTHRRAIEAGVKIHGCTVHFVTPDLDDGPIIAQAAVPVLDDDNEESLAARVLVEEHRLYPLAMRWLGEGRLRVEGRRVLG